VTQARNNLLQGYAFEIESLTAGEYGDWNFVRLGRRENEFYMGRRFFQRLQKGIEGIGGQHVNFVDDEKLETENGREVFDVFAQLPDVVHTGIGGAVYFKDIY
jgi:hypothetical protein